MDIFSQIRKAEISDVTGQPLRKAFRATAIKDRNIDELVGIIKGVLMDGEVNRDEAFALLRWIESNREVLDTWPANVIYPRLSNALLDEVLDEKEGNYILDSLVTLRYI